MLRAAVSEVASVSSEYSQGAGVERGAPCSIRNRAMKMLGTAPVSEEAKRAVIRAHYDVFYLLVLLQS